MISALLGIYAASILASNDIPSAGPHIMPWNENITVESSTIPKKKEENIEPVIDAKAALAVDLKNGLILYEKNIHESLPMASLTKLMTTVLIVEENDPADVVTVSKIASNTEGSKIWLAPGEKITVENLLYASLINSANDAAMALAEFNGGKIKDFVIKMNKRAQELGLYSTHFVNPTGLDNLNYLDDEKADNISSAYDLALLGRYAYGKSIIRRAVSKKELEIASTNEQFKHTLKYTNDLLNSYLNVLGLKTGTTDDAGECLIAIIQNDNGNDILTVVLNSPARYTETKVLADWAFRSYKW